MALALRTMVIPTAANDTMYSYQGSKPRREWVVHLQVGSAPASSLSNTLHSGEEMRAGTACCSGTPPPYFSHHQEPCCCLSLMHAGSAAPGQAMLVTWAGT